MTMAIDIFMNDDMDYGKCSKIISFTNYSLGKFPVLSKFDLQTLQ